MKDRYLIKKIKKDSNNCNEEGKIITCSYGKNSAIKRAKQIAYEKAREYEDNGHDVIVENKTNRSCLYGDIITVQVTRKSHNLYSLDYYYVEKER